MSVYARSDADLLRELGERLRDQRLRRNITQAALAERTLLSLGTIQALERGQGKLATLIAVVRELELLHELEHFLEPPQVSPLALAAGRKKRRRARPPRARHEGGEG